MFEAKHVKMPLIDTGCFHSFHTFGIYSLIQTNMIGVKPSPYRGLKSQTLVKPKEVVSVRIRLVQFVTSVKPLF